MKIGLALGGGAAYGFTHIGVLKVLEKYGIKPDFIAGTSVGSLVGAIYASEGSIKQLEDAAKDFNWLEIVNFTLPKEGLLSIEKIDNFINKHSKVKEIQNTKIKFGVVTTNLLDAKEEVFFDGDMGPLVRASCSLPGIFSPTVYNHKIYVDGGILNNVPISVVKKMGADFIIAVDLLANSRIDILKNNNIFNIVWSSWTLSIQQYTRVTQYKDADIVIKPNILNINPFDTFKKEEIISIGSNITEGMIINIVEEMKKKMPLSEKIKDIIKKISSQND
ncbi:MAG TPA: patatin-like phospholipase family protein [Candidatus Goldiibacteriota bacterium]|nr:patatin-like phospholipase family protein [Candidatus Goldiibacteriota bacterium]